MNPGDVITIEPQELGDGDAVGFLGMGVERVGPLGRECEVGGIETAQDPMEGETWEIDGRLIGGDLEIEIRVDQFTYRLSTRSFFQVNRHLLSTMLRLVSSHAKRVREKRVAIDLFAGVGFFTLPLATLFERVIAVEGSESIDYLRGHDKVEAILSPVETFDIPGADLIFLDPPPPGPPQAPTTPTPHRARHTISY